MVDHISDCGDAYDQYSLQRHPDNELPSTHQVQKLAQTVRRGRYGTKYSYQNGTGRNEHRAP
jgi:hypothetical protein